MAFCKYCGAEVVEEAKFCPQCGATRVENPQDGFIPEQPQPYKRKRLKKESRQIFRANYGIALGTSIIFLLIVAVCGSLSLGLISLLLMGVLTYGLYSVFLNIYRGKEASVGQLFSGFDRFGPTCGAGLLIFLFTFLWSLLLFIPGIIKSYSYSMTYFIMKDHPELKAREAIRASQKLMRGHKWQLFILQLSYFWWYILSTFTAGILLLLYVQPWMYTATAGFYDTIKHEYCDPR